MKRFTLIAVVVLVVLAISPFTALAQDEEFDIDTSSWQTFEAEEGEDDVFVKFMYPEDWLTEVQFGGLIIASSESALEKANSEEETQPEEGEFIATIQLLPTEFLSFFEIEGDDLEAVTTEMAAFFTAESDTEEEAQLEVGEVSIIEFSEELSIGRVPVTDENIEGVLLVFQLTEEVYGVAIGAGYPGELEDNELVLYGIISTLEFTGTVEDLMAQ